MDLFVYISEILASFASFYVQTGYAEKALALFQAMIELNCYAPDSVKSASHSVQIEHLEHFWESGAPRIGEDQASGWKNMNANLHKVPQFPSMSLFFCFMTAFRGFTVFFG